MGTRKLRIDIDGIIDAATAAPELGEPFLDLKSGEVAWRSDLADADDDLGRALEEEPDRFVLVPRYESRDEFDLMRRFADSVGEADVRKLLDVALGGKGSFSRFRDVLGGYPDLEALWREARDSALLEHVKAWLSGIGIEPSFERRKIEAPGIVPRPQEPRIGLFDLLLLGAPEGKTELLEGRVSRRISLPGPSEARALFKRLARELCEHHGVAWRNRFIEGKSTYEVGRAHLTVEDSTVYLEIDVPSSIWNAFAR